jgi:WNK lysine deficient protein kinase
MDQQQFAAAASVGANVASGRETSPTGTDFSPLEDGMRKMAVTQEEEKIPIINCQGSERILEYGGPNNRYGKLNVILGKGAYKVVWKAIDLEEGIEVAWNSCQVCSLLFLLGFYAFRPPKQNL